MHRTPSKKIFLSTLIGFLALAGRSGAQEKPSFTGEKFPSVSRPAQLVEFSEQLYLDGYGVIGHISVMVSQKDKSWPKAVGKAAAQNGGELITIASAKSGQWLKGKPGMHLRVHVSHSGEVSFGPDTDFNGKLIDVVTYEAAVWRHDPERAGKQLLVYREETRQDEGRLKLLQAVERHDLATVRAVLAEGILPIALHEKHPMANLPSYREEEAMEKYNNRRSIIGQAAEEAAVTAEERQKPMFIALARSVKPSKKWEDAFETGYDYELAMLRIFEADDVDMLRAMVENGFSLERMPALANPFLHELVSRGKFKIIRYLADRGISLRSTSLVKGRDFEVYPEAASPCSLSLTPLHVVAEYDWSEAVGPLVRLGVDPNGGMYGKYWLPKCSVPEGATPLHLAAQRGRISVVADLLANGADPQVKTKFGKTALDFARENKRDRVVECLTWASAHPGAAFSAPWPKERSLPAAASRGELGVVRELLAAGSNVNTRDADGNSAIHYAAAAGDPILAGWLLAVPGVDVNAANKMGVKPLDLAGETWLRSRLEKMGASASASPSGLVAAAGAGNLDLVLEDLQAGLDPNARDFLGRTALVEATRIGHVPIMTALLDKGADPRAQDGKGLKPARVAPTLPARALILARGGGVEPSVDALLLAVARNDAILAAGLLDQGVDINGKGSVEYVDFKEFNGTGMTALVVAAAQCNEPLVTLLLQRGANPNIEVYDKHEDEDVGQVRTALDMVRHHKCQKNLETILLGAGAKTWKQIKKGK